MLETLRTYRQLSLKNEWPSWPFVACWVSALGMFVAGIVAAIHLPN
jgi:hypothetical protein